MGVEVKGAGDGVVIADRGCNDGCGYRDHSGWGSGWGAVGGALVGGGFGAAAVSVWDKINDTKADIQKVEATVQEAKSDLALQLERCCCDIKNGQQEIKCLIENTAKDQEIARLNRVVDAQRDQNIINQVVAALKGITTPAQ
nr:MAG: hypothetical protein [Bacteriophage sp.]